ncbi:hypothetical protein KIN20_017247 [Parelaphostrongylus tenuis]|uniref:Uncharacterized protein n=1 Tax=Parelaphostrongylus tenuis TaxID=148309 RepID=A0AAD5MZP7_PARTN|nr:hypothetical protein KIN20_017247 [Parelaphostrongylus tenuis]
MAVIMAKLLKRHCLFTTYQGFYLFRNHGACAFSWSSRRAQTFHLTLISYSMAEYSAVLTNNKQQISK